MSELRLPPLSLYIHIPWCERKCPYCDFNSHRADAALPEAQYVAALMQDLEDDLQYVQHRELHSIFIGGGTPSLFSGEGIATILKGVGERVAIKEEAEITLEANPGSAEAEKFGEFLEAGVNRLSLGIQSLEDAQLLALGRVHDSDQALCAIEMAQGVGFSSLNIDLMHGLPGQSAASAQADLQKVAAYRPAHISWYQLTIEPNTEFHRRTPSLPVESELGKIQQAGESLLAGEGFANYEVSAYARPGYRCHHNLNYWQFGDYLGIGAGAHSKLTQLAASTVRRLAKRRQPAEYLAANSGYRASERNLDEADLAAEYMLNVLRLQEGFELRDFTARTGLTSTAIEERLESLLARDLLELADTRIRASALGRRFLDTVIGEFF